MKSAGKCSFCGKEVSGSAMTKHLSSCGERIKYNASGSNAEKILLIKAEAGPFWVYFELSSSSKLGDIDQFLRDLWVECCGHLSVFKIGEMDYYSQKLEHGDKTMSIKLDGLLSEGMTFSYEYDFGTTTELEMKCISERNGSVRGIKILSRNDPPEFVCDNCGKPAKEICSMCICEGGDTLFCESCAKKHKCGEDYLLPVVNSPRMGMCGYVG